MNIIRRDVTDTFFNPVHLLIRPDDRQNVETRMLGVDELLNYSQDLRYDLSTQSALLIESDNVFCAGTFVDKEMVAYNYFGLHEISPSLNRAGEPFRGIGMRMPKDVVFLFKGFTLPDYRGKRLLALTTVTGCFSLVGPNGWALTTADVNNESSRKMLGSIGLYGSGIKLKEYRILNRSIYRAPKQLQLGDPKEANSKTVELIFSTD